MKKLLLVSLLLVMAACSQESHLQSGDLVFVGSAGSDFEQAISDATSPTSAEISFTHVGIIEKNRDSIFVIDATPQHGVSRRPYDQFLSEQSSDAKIVFKRLAISNPSEFVTNAKQYLGLRYDFSFLPNNDQYYCSELVYDAYVRDGRHLFEAKPMNFRSSDGTFSTYWTALFDSLGMAVPQDTLGTNPNDMANSPILKTIRP